MAAGSAGCLAAGSLCVACLVLYLGEWRPPPGPAGTGRRRRCRGCPGLRGRVDGRGRGGRSLGWGAGETLRAERLVPSSARLPWVAWKQL